MEYLIGGLLAAATAGFASTLGHARDRSFFPTILSVIATYSVLFAAMDRTGQTLRKESVIGSVTRQYQACERAFASRSISF